MIAEPNDVDLIIQAEGEDVPTIPREHKFWSRPLVLVLVSVCLSSGISGAVVSFGWKASMDTFSAVSTVKIQEHETKIERLELDRANQISKDDLAIRDQLLDAKLSAVQYEIQALKEQIANSRVEHR